LLDQVLVHAREVFTIAIAKLANRAHSWRTQSGATAHLTPDFGRGKLPKTDSNRRE